MTTRILRNSSGITRRDFLASSTRAASALAVGHVLLRARPAAGAARRLSPNEKLNLAFIGVSGRGTDNRNEITAAEDNNVIALCDVDETRLNEVGTKFPGAKRYRDYRKMLEGEKSLDGVVISIPDHNHAAASMMALKLG